MKKINKREPFILFLGDLLAFSLALWGALFVRYGEVPSLDLLSLHAIPFGVLAVLWVGVFFIAGLYEKHTLVFKDKLPSLILNTQIANSIIAVSFFYVVPIFGITPKIVLALYITISFLLVVFWRMVLVTRLNVRTRESAILIGSGVEMEELYQEVNGNERYDLRFVSRIDLSKPLSDSFEHDIVRMVEKEGITSVVMDLRNKEAERVLPALYKLIFSKVRFMDMHRVYEETFDRIPLSLVGYNWFLENISVGTHTAYDVVKRAMDLSIASVLGTCSLIVYPFVILAIKLEDGGPAFITQERIGQGNRLMYLWKFRSMRGSDKGVWLTDGDTRVTRVGKFLRKSRIDELPQLWNVVRGDISLIGPRPDIIGLGTELAQKLPYYTIRNLIKPGLSGWAQLKQDLPPQSLEETRLRLSYDLYYVKNRSVILDLMIALRTIKVLLSRTGL